MEDCDQNTHDSLIANGELICPFCSIMIYNSETKREDICCDNMEIINNNGKYVCKSCGLVHRYDTNNKYCDFYSKRYRRKSIYQRKYYIERILLKFKLSHSDRQKTKITFKKCENVISKIDGIKRYPKMN